MRNFLRTAFAALVALFFAGKAAYAQNEYLVSTEFIESVSEGLLGVPFVFSAVNAIDYYKITYNTVDVHGEPTIASGAVGIPKSDNCDVHGMIMYCHGTVLRKQDVPSANNMESQAPKVFAGQGYISCAPDYLGLGVNPGLHPYVHAQSQATASVDMYFATKEFIESMGDIHHNGELFITGYSQGGHASMATIKYAQDNGLLEEMGIKAGAPCSGPYNMSGSQAEVLLSGEPYTNPGYVVYLLKSYELAYGTIYNELSDIIQSPYHEIVLPYFDGMQNEYDMSVVNDLLPQSLPDLLVDTVLANMASNDNHPIWKALRDNDNYDWAPQIPMRLYYCNGDEQVPFENSVVARDSMLAKGATDVQAISLSATATHVLCIVPALIAARNYFNSVASPCGTVASTAFESKPGKLLAWPNPAQTELRFSLPETGGTLLMYDLYGKLVQQQLVQSNQLTIDVSTLASGAYIAVYQGNSGRLVSKVVIE